VQPSYLRRRRRSRYSTCSCRLAPGPAVHPCLLFWLVVASVLPALTMEHVPAILGAAGAGAILLQGSSRCILHISGVPSAQINCPAAGAVWSRTSSGGGVPPSIPSPSFVRWRLLRTYMRVYHA
jgi:hypothetical protein